MFLKKNNEIKIFAFFETSIERVGGDFIISILLLVRPESNFAICFIGIFLGIVHSSCPSKYKFFVIFNEFFQ